MKAFVINLERHGERRRSMVEQLTAAGLEFEIVPAVDGRAMSEAELDAACDQQRAQQFVFRRLTAGEIGCALSHMKVLRRIVADSLPMALVLEDDALIGPGVPEVLAALESLPISEEPEAFLLTHVLKYSAWPKYDGLCEGRGFYPIVDASCCHGYVVTQAAARRLLAYFADLHHPCDYWSTLRRRRVVKAYGLVPYCIGHSNLASESDIDPERRRISARLHIPLASRARRLARRYLFEKFIYQVAKPFLRVRRQQKGALEKAMKAAAES